MERSTDPNPGQQIAVPAPAVAFIISAQDRSITLVAELSALAGMLNQDSPAGILARNSLVIANTLALEAGDAADALR